MMKRFIALFLAILAGNSFAQPQVPWLQSELAVDNFVTLSNHQCMGKSAAAMFTCNSEKCLNLMVGVAIDCMSFADDKDQLGFCTAYQSNYYDANCPSTANAMTYGACERIRLLEDLLCNSDQQSMDDIFQKWGDEVTLAK